MTRRVVVMIAQDVMPVPVMQCAVARSGIAKCRCCDGYALSY